MAGNTTVQFSATDQNLKKILLYIDQAPFDVTGQASYEWDTSLVGDGVHMVRLVATDQAGNQAEEQVTVTTTNVELATERSQQAGYQSGISLGVPLGLPAELSPAPQQSTRSPEKPSASSHKPFSILVQKLMAFST